MFFSKVNIEIGSYKVTHVNEVRFAQSDKELLSLCTIKLPYIKNVGDQLRKGDKVIVKLSMSIDFNQDDFKTEFIGYLKNITLGIPLTLEIENGVYLLKKKSVAGFYRGITLKALLEKILKGFDSNFEIVYSASIPQITLDKFLIKKGSTTYDVLKHLISKYRIKAYFKLDKLYVGSRYLIEKAPPVVVYNLEQNVAKDNIVLRSKNDVVVLVKATSRLRDGNEIQVEVGDPGGSIRTFFYHNIKTEKHLRELAEKEIEEIKLKKTKGSIKVFGLPYVEHSYTAQVKAVKDYDKPKEGRFFIEKVETIFSVSEGFRRVLHLGKKLS